MRFFVRILICVVVFAAGTGVVIAEGEAKVEVQVAGLRVVGDGYGKGADRLLPLNWRRGTTVALMVSTEEGSVLDLDPTRSTLEFFKDDKGTNLRPGPESARPAFGLFPRQSGDRRAVLVEIWGDEVAAKDAKELLIKGALELVVGRGRKTERTGEIAPRSGAAAILGPRTVAVLSGLPFPDEVEKEDEEKGDKETDSDGKEGDEKDKGDGDNEEKKEGGDDEDEGVEKEDGKFVLSLRIDGEPDNVANVKVLDGEGKPLKVKALGVRAIRRGEVRSIYRFQLPEGFEGDIVVEADIWEGRRTERVPFEERISVGLGGGR